MRALVGVERGGVWAISRTGHDATVRFPELAGLGPALGDVDALLDGEVVALDEAGVPSFERLQPRMQAGSPAAARQRAAEQAVAFMVFDVLWIEGHSTCELPYTDRRILLERLALAGDDWQTPPSTAGGGAAVLAASKRLGLEGVVAKRLDSRYLPGKRSDAWRKVKPTLGQELVVGGWLPGAGRLEGQLGSLLVGYHDRAGAPGPLRFAGRVGSGIDAAQRAALDARLGPLRRATSPFEATPRLPGRCGSRPRSWSRSRSTNGRRAGVLRAPRYRGLPRRQARRRRRPRDLTGSVTVLP